MLRFTELSTLSAFDYENFYYFPPTLQYFFLRQSFTNQFQDYLVNQQIKH